MCKIYVSSIHQPRNLCSQIEKIWQHFADSGEKDGFGAAWLSPSGKVQILKSRFPSLENRLSAITDSFHLSPKNWESDGGFLLVHGRTATNKIDLANTHPMTARSCALIHNGVVNSDTLENKNCSNDSELLIEAIKENKLGEISGYFAAALLEPKKLTIVRDDQARLVCCKLAEGKKIGIAFATTLETLRMLHGKKYALPVRNNIKIVFTGPLALTTSTIAKKPRVQVKSDYGKFWPTEEERAELNKALGKDDNIAENGYLFADEKGAR